MSFVNDFSVKKHHFLGPTTPFLHAWAIGVSDTRQSNHNCFLFCCEGVLSQFLQTFPQLAACRIHEYIQHLMSSFLKRSMFSCFTTGHGPQEDRLYKKSYRIQKLIEAWK